MLSIRLETLTKYIDIKDKIIDIGCDHAYLSIELVKKHKIKSAIVSDISNNALNVAKENIEKNKLSDYIDARLGDGLEVLNENDNINTILISGMGTSTILHILNSPYLNKINKLVIQSNNDHSLLRSELIKKGFVIKNEEFFVDGKIHYINIVFVRGEKKYSKLELKYGPILIHNKNYIEFEIKNILKIYNLIPKNKIKYRLVLKKELKVLEKINKKC